MSSVIGAWRSLGKDPSVLKQRVKPGTVKKTLLFALPYTRLLVLFLLAVIVHATIGMAKPSTAVSIKTVFAPRGDFTSPARCSNST
jgi:hypothetical protein